ncbi:MAG: sigma-70 family RNA polymerase sigma factor [Deltaproteobacteria bacterium]|nr:sigma-70 family RNA polymerase sigma factor [Deltaproteobacteria bacterium]
MSDQDLAVPGWMNRVRNQPLLSREEEHQLAVRYQAGDRRAGDLLVESNLRFVLSVARKYHRYGLRMQDLVAEGNVGLATALKKFDPHKGTRFVTYAAYWIRAYILNFVIRSWSLVGGGSGPLRSKLFFQIRRERARIGQLVHDRDEAVAALAEKLAISVEKLEPMLARLDGRDVSLDAPLYAEGDGTRGDSLEGDSVPADEMLDNSRTKNVYDLRVSAALSRLDPRERLIVERRIMSDDELSLAELGRQLGVSRERARQLEARARKKLELHLSDLRDTWAAAA